MAEEKKFQLFADVEGAPLTLEARIIGALVREHGGEVEIERQKLAEIEGLVIEESPGSPSRIRIRAN